MKREKREQNKILKKENKIKINKKIKNKNKIN